MELDISVRRVIEALAPGPATPGILANRFGLDKDEAVEALAAAVDEGWAEEVPPLAFGLTSEGADLAREMVSENVIVRTAQDVRDAGARGEAHALRTQGDEHATAPVLRAGAKMRQHANVTGGRN